MKKNFRVKMGCILVFFFREVQLSSQTMKMAKTGYIISLIKGRFSEKLKIPVKKVLGRLRELSFLFAQFFELI